MGIGVAQTLGDLYGRGVTRPEQQQSEFNLEILLNSALGIAALSFLGEMDDAEAWRYIDQAKSYFLHLAEKKLNSPNTEGLSYSSSLDHGSRFAFEQTVRSATPPHHLAFLTAFFH